MTREQTKLLDGEAIRATIHEQIDFNFRFDGESDDFSDDASLVEQNIVDPTGIVEIVLFIEETYGIEVAEKDLTPENFDTVNNITRYVQTRLTNM